MAETNATNNSGGSVNKHKYKCQQYRQLGRREQNKQEKAKKLAARLANGKLPKSHKMQKTKDMIADNIIRNTIPIADPRIEKERQKREAAKKNAQKKEKPE